MQDEFAWDHRTRRKPRLRLGKFKDEIIPITIKDRKGDIKVEQDEFPRFGATMEGMAKLKPAFQKDGTVTAGNASGINDGAAILVVMTADEAKKRGVNTARAYRIMGKHVVLILPLMGQQAPFHRSRKALERAGWKVGDLDLIEANEAFAAQAMACK